jgi:ATP-binding cassette subfamily F protein uup
LQDVLTGGGDKVEVGGETRHVISYMKDFLFTPEQARTPVNVLSGGERARLLLAKALAKPGNLLVLDEPTNDLDLETLDLLEEMIDEYPGTVLLVSHDRDFLDRTVTAIIFAEGDGRFTDYAGGYSDMVAQRGGGVETTKAEKSAEKKDKAAARERARAEAPRKKLSFKDKHALEKMPGEIERLTALIAKLHQDLANPALYAKDPGKVAEINAALTKAHVDRATAEERWLELEALREEIEGK